MTDRNELPIELSGEEMSAVSAGKSNTFAYFGDIKGETTGDGHRGEILLVDYNHTLTSFLPL